METMNPYFEAFHHRVILKIMDVAIPEWARYVAIDKSTMICVYSTLPIINEHHREWDGEEENGKCEYLWSSEKDPLSIKIPDEFVWTDCVWKL